MKINGKISISLLLAAVILLSVVIKLNLKTTNISEVMSVDWGLSFQNKGDAPVGNVNNAELKKYGAAFLGDVKENKIYLTFDAGYEAGYTEKILDVLKEENVKACFFIVGNYLETAPDLVKRMVNEGHTVANHTYNHPDMSKIESEESFLKELKAVEEKYKEITNEEMEKFYRPPQGKFSIENLKMAEKNGYKTVFWSLAYVDWLKDKQPLENEALNKLTERIHPGAIILLHSTSETNSKILKELINKYREMGYEFAAIDEVFK